MEPPRPPCRPNGLLMRRVHGGHATGAWRCEWHHERTAGERILLLGSPLRHTVPLTIFLLSAEPKKQRCYSLSFELDEAYHLDKLAEISSNPP